MSDLYKLIWDDIQEGDLSLFEFRKIVTKHAGVSYNTPYKLSAIEYIYIISLIIIPTIFFIVFI